MLKIGNKLGEEKDLEKSIVSFIDSVELSFTEETPNGFLGVVWILCDI